MEIFDKESRIAKKFFEKEEQFVELGSVSELTLGYLWEVPEGLGRFYNPGY